MSAPCALRISRLLMALWRGMAFIRYLSVVWPPYFTNPTTGISMWDRLMQASIYILESWGNGMLFLSRLFTGCLWNSGFNTSCSCWLSRGYMIQHHHTSQTYSRLTGRVNSYAQAARVSRYDTMRYHTILYHIISYHIISYHIISYHTIPYHTIHHISYHIISYLISHHITSYHISYYIIYHTIPCHTIPYHTTELINPASLRKNYISAPVHQNITSLKMAWNGSSINGSSSKDQTCGNRACSTAGPKQRNSLPPSLQSCTSLRFFKWQLRTDLFAFEQLRFFTHVIMVKVTIETGRQNSGRSGKGYVVFTMVMHCWLFCRPSDARFIDCDKMINCFYMVQFLTPLF